MPKHVASEVVQSLRGRIQSGEWSATRRLPNERLLADEYKVARNTMRRAIDVIEQDGIVTRHVGRGTFIRAETGDDFAQIMRRIAGTSPRDIMNVRMLVEPQAAASAASNASADDLASIREAHDRAQRAVGMEEFESWDAEFHKRIFASTRNEFLAGLHDILRLVRNRAPWLEIKRRTFSEERRQAYCRQHADILVALDTSDVEGASLAMRTHLGAVSRNLFGGSGLD